MKFKHDLKLKADNTDMSTMAPRYSNKFVLCKVDH